MLAANTRKVVRYSGQIAETATAPPSRFGGAGAGGRNSVTATSAEADSSAANRKGARQPNSEPTTLPIGMPSTKARVMPPATIASADPRRSGGTIEAAATLAAGPD